MRKLEARPPEDIQKISQAEGKVKFQAFCLKIETEKAPQFINLTRRIRQCVAESKVRDGSVTIFSRHTTAAIKINENEPLLIRDMERFLERIAPRDGNYLHNDFSIRTVNMTEDECPNGHAHCQQLLLSTSETIPIIDGALQIGQWQSIFLIELDRPRSREVLVQVMGG